MADQPGAGPDTPASAHVCGYWADGRDHYRPGRELAGQMDAPGTAAVHRECEPDVSP